MDVTDLGKYTVVPPLVQAVVGFVSGGLADNLIARGISVRNTRRTLQVCLRRSHPVTLLPLNVLACAPTTGSSCVRHSLTCNKLTKEDSLVISTPAHARVSLSVDTRGCKCR